MEQWHSVITEKHCTRYLSILESMSGRLVITSRPACVIRQKIHLHDVIFRDAGFMRNKKGAKLFKKLRPVFMSRSDGRKKCVDYLV